MNPLDIVRRILIWPILSDRPETEAEKKWLDAAFCVDSRRLCTFRALRDFEMPGLYMVHQLYPTQGIPVNRQVVRKDFIWVRKDLTQPYYHLQHGDNVFQLRPGEWRKVAKKLRQGRGQDGL